MKIVVLLFAFAFVLSLGLLANASPDPQAATFKENSNALANVGKEVTIELHRVANSKGKIEVGIFNTDKGFPDKAKPIRRLETAAHEGSMQIKIEDLPPGKYALTVLHDENENGKMDFTGLGMPKEGFGFSKNPRIVFSAPSFKDCEFTVGDNGATEVVEMKHY